MHFAETKAENETKNETEKETWKGKWFPHAPQNVPNDEHISNYFLMIYLFDN